MTEEELAQKEHELKLREEALQVRELRHAIKELDRIQIMADLREEKVTYQALQQECNEQKAMLIQLCKDLDFDFNE